MPSNIKMSSNRKTVPRRVTSSVSEIAVTYNLSFEPSFKYRLSTFADKPNEKTFHKLRNHVLYIETPFKRYEISK